MQPVMLLSQPTQAWRRCSPAPGGTSCRISTQVNGQSYMVSAGDCTVQRPPPEYLTRAQCWCVTAQPRIVADECETLVDGPDIDGARGAVRHAQSGSGVAGRCWVEHWTARDQYCSDWSRSKPVLLQHVLIDRGKHTQLSCIHVSGSGTSSSGTSSNTASRSRVGCPMHGPAPRVSRKTRVLGRRQYNRCLHGSML
jgi:hypothetical protein